MSRFRSWDEARDKWRREDPELHAEYLLAKISDAISESITEAIQERAEEQGGPQRLAERFSETQPTVYDAFRSGAHLPIGAIEQMMDELGFELRIRPAARQ